MTYKVILCDDRVLIKTQGTVIPDNAKLLGYIHPDEKFTSGMFPVGDHAYNKAQRQKALKMFLKRKYFLRGRVMSELFRQKNNNSKRSYTAFIP